MQWYCKVSLDRKHLYETDNVDELWEKLKAEVKISYPIETFDYGMREVVFLIRMAI